jgi:hypothetical protein
MNPTMSNPRPNDRVLDLVGAFVESTNARLRGNAIQALVALVNSEDSDLAGRAEETLAQAIVSGPASAEMEWQRQFRSRALNAMEHLAPTTRSRTFEHMRTTHRQSKDPMQRAALASFLLEANAKGLLARPTSWFELRRLTRSLATVGFLRAIWQALWRFSVAVAAIYIVITIVPFVLTQSWELNSEKAYNQIGALSVVPLAALAFLPFVTLIGRLELSIRERVIEAALCGIIFAAISVFGAMLPLDKTWADLSEPWIGLAIVGAVIGVAVRSLKWLPDTEHTAIYPAKLFLAAVVATLVGMAAARCGMDPKVAGASWLVLAPSAVAAVSFDSWLETIGPNLAPLVDKPKNTRASFVIAGFLVVGCVAVVFEGYQNLSRAFPPPRTEMLGTNLIERKAKSPHRLELDVSKQGSYTIYAAPDDGTTDIALTIKKEGERATVENHNREKQSEETTNSLSAGKFFICASRANQPCNFTFDLVDFAAALIAGEPFLPQDDSLDLNIKIFPADHRPPTIPAIPAKPG